MKTQCFFLSIVFIFLLVDLNGQESAISIPEITEGSSTTSFNWKPFTIELNSSSIGHGISIEKDLIKNMSFRVGISSDFNSSEYMSMGYKINFGVMRDILNYRFLSLRTGLDFGMRKMTPAYHSNDFIYCGIGLISSEPISVGFIDIPLLLQFNITEKISFELGVRTMFQSARTFSDMIDSMSESPTSSYYNYDIDTRIHNYHVGLRYTFTE